MDAILTTKQGQAEFVLDSQTCSRVMARVGYPGYEAANKLDQYDGLDCAFYVTSLFEPDMWCWDGESGYDYEIYDAHVRALLSRKPDLRLVLFIGGRAGAPYLWCRNHPEQLITKEDGVATRLGSFASHQWIADSTEAIRRVVSHFESSEFAEHIVGYNPILADNEWRHCLDRDGFADFSVPMLDGFRSWLRTVYQDDVAELRRRWHDPEVDFDTAGIPTGLERRAWNHSGFFHYIEQCGYKVADYYRCYADLGADLALGYCKTIKDAVCNRKLVGIMHAYTYCGRFFWPFPHSSLYNAGHRILQSPHIDFFHSPYHYYNRCLGGVHYPQVATDSVLLNGKAYLDQIDAKTYVHQGYNTNARTLWETRQLLLRDAAFSIAKGCHTYWYEMGNGTFGGQNNAPIYRGYTYDTPDIRKLIQQLQTLSDRVHAQAPQQVAQVALFTSQNADVYRKLENTYANFFVEGLRQFILPYTAVPFDDYMLEDIADVKRSYRVYIFPNAHRITSAQREAIHFRLARDNATALWFYAPGYIDEDGPSMRNMELLTGVTIDRDSDRREVLQASITDTDHVFTRGLAGARSFGSDIDPQVFQKRQEWEKWFSSNRDDYRFSPVFFARDSISRTLARFSDTGESALVVKPMPGWRSVYFAAPLPPTALLRNVFRDSGAHVYSDRHDVVYANSRFAAICCNGAGRRTLALPGTTSLYDALQGGCLVQDAAEFSWCAADNETRLYLLDA